MIIAKTPCALRMKVRTTTTTIMIVITVVIVIIVIAIIVIIMESRVGPSIRVFPQSDFLGPWEAPKAIEAVRPHVERAVTNAWLPAVQ